MEASDTEVNGANGTDGAADVALLTPPPVPAVKTAHVPMPRRGLASKGNKVELLTNHFKVYLPNVDGHFYHYRIALYEDGRPVDGKGIGRKVLDLVHDNYKDVFEGKDFAYDGEKSLFTVGALPEKQLVFSVMLEDISSNRSNGNSSPYQPKTYRTYRVEIFYAAKIPMQAIVQALCDQDSKNSQEALRVLHVSLIQQAAKQGSLRARQSFFLSDVEGGVLGCGVHSSFRTTQGGLSLNIDVSTSTTMIIQPGPVDFLMANQNAKDPSSLDWAKAKRVLKNLRVKSSAMKREYKITGLSDKICKELMCRFSMKQIGEKNENKLITELSVYEYYVTIRKIDLPYSGDLPCIIVGKPKRPTYIPLELCSMVSLQHYTAPTTRMRTLTNNLKIINYAEESLLRACGCSVISTRTKVEGRILAAPKLRVGNGEYFIPRNGRWNFNNKKLVEPTTIANWAVVNFSARCNTQSLINDFIKCGNLKGIKISRPSVFEESSQDAHARPLVRVKKMFEWMKPWLSEAPDFLLCLLPERKNSLLCGCLKSSVSSSLEKDEFDT